MINFYKLLPKFLPYAQWSCPGKGTDQERYDALVFHDATPKPSLDQFSMWQSEFDAEQSDTEYQRLRKKVYPSQEDLLIALWEKNMEGRPEAADALQVERAAIKLQYPKLITT